MEINPEKLLRMLVRTQEEGYVFKDGKMVRKIKRLFSVELVTAVVVCLAVLSAFVYAGIRKDIIIEDISGSKSIATLKGNVAEVLKDHNIIVNNADRINVNLDQRLTDGLKIVITRSNNITVTADGKKLNMMSVASTVKDILAEAKIEIGEKDRVSPALDAKIKGDTDIWVTRVIEKIVNKVENLTFKNSLVRTDKLDVGMKKVIKQGKDGKKEVSTKIIYEDGVQISSNVIGDKVIQQPIDGLIEEGTKSVLITSRGEVKRFKKSTIMTATAYDLSFESCGKLPDHPQYGITRSGLRAKEGIVAVDPTVIPLGTWLYVEGYGEALAADTGGAIKGNRIDLFFNSEKKVDQYGKKKVKVYILDKPRYKF